MTAIKRILIANRGEIACRIIRSCQSMGISTVAVFSNADKHALHVKMADTAIYLGESEVSKSYLDIDKLIWAAKTSGADAVHPGYGFLSENAVFAKRLSEENLIFIGPNPNAIEQMGSKTNAKALAEKQGVPTVPGYKGSDQSFEKFKTEAVKIGFPILLKASSGGGGKGMRIVHTESELSEAFNAAKREAKSAFGDDELLMEKYFVSSRHIEVQILGDKHGHVIHLLERECTIQRRYQKIIEESPSPVLTETSRTAICNAAVKLAQALDYDNAGTVEFIWSKGDFYFLEVNTRLQVEHPITEAITGLDLVKLQIEIAAGKPLEVKQEDIKANGYALECRLYAEDTANNFLPTTGKILQWHTTQTEGLRYDTGVAAQYEVSIFYDPMLAKIIAHGKDRQETIQRMEYALSKMICLGTTTNLSFLKNVVAHPLFLDGEYDTRFLSLHFGENSQTLSSTQTNLGLIAATITHFQTHTEPQKLLKEVPAAWRNQFSAPQKISFEIDKVKTDVLFKNNQHKLVISIVDKQFDIRILSSTAHSVSLLINNQLHNFHYAICENEYYIQHNSFAQIKLTNIDKLPLAIKEKQKGEYISPMPASIVKVLVSLGQHVKVGQSLMILSSMKMENTVAAEDDGEIEEIYVSEAQNITAGKLLLKLKTLS